jgi:hypothetical protein
VRSITTLSPSTQRFGILRRLSPWRDRKSEDKQVDIINLKGGTSAFHLTDRIARDKPEILEEMKAGKFTRSGQRGRSEASGKLQSKAFSQPADLPSLKAVQLLAYLEGRSPMSGATNDSSLSLPDLIKDHLLAGEAVLYEAYNAKRSKIRLVITDQRILGLRGKKTNRALFSLSLLEIKKIVIKSEKVLGPWIVVISDIYGQSTRFTKLEKPGLFRFIVFQAIEDRKEFGTESPHLQPETQQAIRMAIGASESPVPDLTQRRWVDLAGLGMHEN